jgi:type I restriction enzyme M protein
MRKDVGVDGDAQRISQMVWLIFLKIFDDKEKEWELSSDYKSPIPRQYRWRNWAKDDEDLTGEDLIKFVNNDLFPALKELATRANVSKLGRVVGSVFEDGYNYMKSGNLLREVINRIEKDIDFNKSEDRHLFNDIYEKILKDLQSAGNAGEYYTPRAVTQFMVEMVNPKLGETVFDPACGTGGFLANAIEHIKKQTKTVDDRKVLQNSIFGVEKKPLPHMLAVTNMFLHGIEVPSNIKHDNTLSRPLRDYPADERYDCIITNPPFGGQEEDGIEKNFPQGFQTRETADLFLVLIMKLLKPNGRAGIVLPDGTLFGEGVKTKIKEKLLEECNLHTIVRLPNGVFNPYTGIRTNLLFFTKGEPTREVWYYEMKHPEGVKNYNKTRPMHVSEFDVIKAWWNKDTKAGRAKRKETVSAWKGSYEDIKANNFNLDIKNPNTVAEDNGDPEKILIEYNKLEKEITELQNKLKEELNTALNK